MPRYITSIEAPLPVADVFAFMADFRNAVQWDPRTKAAEKETEGAVGVGTLFLLTVEVMGRRTEMPYEIKTHLPDRRLVVEGRTALFSYRDELTFEPTGAATSRLTYDARLSLRGPLALANSLLASSFRDIGDEGAAGIRRVLNARAAG